MRGVRDDLTAVERARLTSAHRHIAAAQGRYDRLFLELVDRRGIGAVARALGLSNPTVHQRAERLRSKAH